MLRTLGLPCLLLQNPGPWFWGWKKKNLLQYHGVQLGGICGPRCPGSGPRHGLRRERGPHGEGAGTFLWGWSGRAAWVQGVLGEVGEAPLSRPAVRPSSGSGDPRGREGEGRLKRQALRDNCSGTASRRPSVLRARAASCRPHLPGPFPALCPVLHTRSPTSPSSPWRVGTCSAEGETEAVEVLNIRPKSHTKRAM